MGKGTRSLAKSPGPIATSSIVQRQKAKAPKFAGSPAAHVLNLQKTMGNRAVRRLLLDVWHEGANTVAVRGQVPEPRLQRERLPCYSERQLDIYVVNLPGSSRSIFDDIGPTNRILCQCGIELNVVGSESWGTDLLDRHPPRGILNYYGPSRSQELREMLSYRPGGRVLHLYYVPSTTFRNLRGKGFISSSYGRFTRERLNALFLTNMAVVDTLAHELGHVLMDQGGHHPDRDNLMADGARRHIGADELEEWQCNRMGVI